MTRWNVPLPISQEIIIVYRLLVKDTVTVDLQQVMFNALARIHSILNKKHHPVSLSKRVITKTQAEKTISGQSRLLVLKGSNTIHHFMGEPKANKETIMDNREGIFWKVVAMVLELVKMAADFQVETQGTTNARGVKIVTVWKGLIGDNGEASLLIKISKETKVIRVIYLETITINLLIVEAIGAMVEFVTKCKETTVTIKEQKVLHVGILAMLTSSLPTHMEIRVKVTQEEGMMIVQITVGHHKGTL